MHPCVSIAKMTGTGWEAREGRAIENEGMAEGLWLGLSLEEGMDWNGKGGLVWSGGFDR